MPKLTVIVPVYQAEKYITRCAQSILGQQVSELELILVDDGSPDRSGELCEQIAAQDARVRVIYQENSGVSAARNAGIEAARGEYVQFVDADDTIGANYSASMLEMMEHSGVDLVISGYTTCLGERRVETVPQSEGIWKTEQIAGAFESLYLQVLLNSPVNRLYRRDKLQSRFPKGIRMGEDFIFNMEYLCDIERVAWCPNAGYFYDKENEQSATTHRCSSALQDVFDYAQAARRFLALHRPQEEVERVYLRILFLRFCTHLNSFAGQGDFSGFQAAAADERVQPMLKAVDTTGFPLYKRLACVLLKLGWIGLLWKMMRR